MKKSDSHLFHVLAPLMLLSVSLLLLTGCMSILEDEMLVENRHIVTPNSRLPVEQTEVTNYDELKAALLELVIQHVETGQILYYSFDEDVQDDIELACLEIQSSDPICAYAVTNISTFSTKIVSYFEIDINIEYRHSKQQIDSIVTISNSRYLGTELLGAMSDYRDEVLIRTALRDITAVDMPGYIAATYYDYPRSIVMMPVTAVRVYPEEGDDKIFELRFGNIEQPAILRRFGESLSGAVRRYAAAAEGDNDGEILLSLAENLIGFCAYDEGVAKVISEHGTQNYSATAYGALVTGSAVGEGFAMAYKALCEELGIECIVVLGYLDRTIHAWNVVKLYGDYYHIDVSMCAKNGIETAFLKTDADLAELYYMWDYINTVNCRGDLTYEEIAGIEPQAPDELDEEGNPINPEDGEADSEEPGEEEQAGDDDSGYAVEEQPEEPNEPDGPGEPEKEDEPIEDST